MHGSFAGSQESQGGAYLRLPDHEDVEEGVRGDNSIGGTATSSGREELLGGAGSPTPLVGNGGKRLVGPAVHKSTKSR